MVDISGSQFFERAITVHRFDCEAISSAGAVSCAEAQDGATVAGETALNEVIAGYVVAIRPIYDGLRRLIGQVAGLLVLVHAGGRRDVLDLPEVSAARERWSDLEQRLGAIQSPQGLQSHFRRLEAAHATLGEVLHDLDFARLQPDWQQHLDRAGERVKRAYAFLQAASEPRVGMTPVDFSHACCGCAQRSRQKGGSYEQIFDLGA
jgi:hypothetical protein